MCHARRVLVVDDSAAVRRVLAATLADEGYTVQTASHGAQALALLPRADPCLILLDLRMPVLDGRAFARAYRALPGVRAPIIVVTGTALAPLADPELAGAVVLDKPFLLAELRTLVAAHLPPS